MRLNWEERIREHRDLIDKENRERENRIEEAEKKEKSWELLRECRNFLKENVPTWKEEKGGKHLEDKEKDKRLAKGKEKKLAFIHENLVQKKVTEIWEKLPLDDKENFRREEERKKRFELREAKINIWKKWRGKETKPEGKTNIENQEEKLAKLEEILIKVQRENEERRAAKEKEMKRRKKVVEDTKRKDTEKKRQVAEKETRVERKKKLEEKWAMLRWITSYIDLNTDKWERERKSRQMEDKKIVATWEKLSRLEKIKKIREKKYSGEKNLQRKGTTTTPPDRINNQKKEHNVPQEKSHPENVQSPEPLTTPQKSMVMPTLSPPHAPENVLSQDTPTTTPQKIVVALLNNLILDILATPSCAKPTKYCTKIQLMTHPTTPEDTKPLPHPCTTTWTTWRNAPCCPAPTPTTAKKFKENLNPTPPFPHPKILTSSTVQCAPPPPTGIKTPTSTPPPPPTCVSPASPSTTPIRNLSEKNLPGYTQQKNEIKDIEKEKNSNNIMLKTKKKLFMKLESEKKPGEKNSKNQEKRKIYKTYKRKNT